MAYLVGQRMTQGRGVGRGNPGRGLLNPINKNGDLHTIARARQRKAQRCRLHTWRSGSNQAHAEFRGRQGTIASAGSLIYPMAFVLVLETLTPGRSDLRMPEDLSYDLSRLPKRLRFDTREVVDP
jgi:hypothetical protein